MHDERTDPSIYHSTEGLVRSSQALSRTNGNFRLLSRFRHGTWTAYKSCVSNSNLNHLPAIPALLMSTSIFEQYCLTWEQKSRTLSLQERSSGMAPTSASGTAAKILSVACWVRRQPIINLAPLLARSIAVSRPIPSLPETKTKGHIFCQKAFTSGFFHRFCGFKNNRTYETLSLGEESLSLVKNPFIFMGEIWNFPWV